jgi:hypothetical protein
LRSERSEDELEEYESLLNFVSVFNLLKYCSASLKNNNEFFGAWMDRASGKASMT